MPQHLFHEYNNFGELASVKTEVAGESILEIDYHTPESPRDQLGRIVEKTETTSDITTKWRYGYDENGRLTNAWKDGKNISRYKYDVNGNRIEHLSLLNNSDISSDNIRYDVRDRLLKYGAYHFKYNANGDTVSMTKGKDITHYAYDALGSLRKVDLPDKKQIEYIVDGRGRRIAKKVDGLLKKGFQYQNQLYPAAEFDATGKVISTFIYLPHENTPAFMLSRKEDGRTWKAYKLVVDNLGSVRMVIASDTGKVIQKLGYDEFGNVLIDSNQGFQPFGFAGGIYDPDTGLVRFGWRDYNPVIGRWTQIDPILFSSGSTNLYSYVDNDPVNNIDITGLDSADEWARIHIRVAVAAFGTYATKNIPT